MIKNTIPKIKKRILIPFLCISSIFASSVSGAAKTEELEFYNNGRINITGRAANESVVTVNVIEFDDALWDNSLNWEENKNFNIQYYDSVKVNDDEKYSFDFRLKKNGNFYVYVGGVTDELETYVIHYTNKEDNENAILSLKNAVEKSDIDEITKLISDRVYDFCVYTDEYKKADASDKTTAAKILLDAIAKEPKITDDYKILAENITKAYVCSLIRASKISDLNEFAYSFYLDEESMLSKCYTPECGKNMLSKLSDKNSIGIGDFDTLVRNSIIEYTVKVSGSVDDVEKLLTEMSDYIGIKNVSSISDELIRKIRKESNVVTVADIGKYINSYKPDENGKSYTGGGSGGSSRVPSPSSRVDTTIATDKNSKAEDNKKDIFSDIDNYEWARESIEELYKTGVVNGKGNNEFRPQDNVTREEFVKMILGAAKIDLDFKDNTPPSDVKETDWFYKYIMCAYEAGIINGISENEFGTGLYITRQDIAKIMYETIKLCGYEITEQGNDFSDENAIADYSKEAVNKLRLAGIINGYENNEFRPNDFANRAEAAKMIYGLSNYLK